METFAFCTKATRLTHLPVLLKKKIWQLAVPHQQFGLQYILHTSLIAGACCWILDLYKSGCSVQTVTCTSYTYNEAQIEHYWFSCLNNYSLILYSNISQPNVERWIYTISAVWINLDDLLVSWFLCFYLDTGIMGHCHGFAVSEECWFESQPVLLFHAWG